MAARMFGTNGVRGVVNQDMTAELALQMGKAIGTVFGKVVAIATDTRVSSDMIKYAVSSGLMFTGCDVRDLGVVPTPALQYYVKNRSDVTGGVMITASHNPPEFNGIKCVSPDGTEASRAEEELVEECYETEISSVPWEAIGHMEKIVNAGEEYIDAVISLVDVNTIREANLQVCLDCANGAACGTSPQLLKKLGVRAITLNSNPQGEFPGHLSEPTEDNLADLKKLTRSTGSNLGIAHDGDADRCVFVTSEGEFVSGDKSLALMAKYILSEKDGKVYTPVSSSAMVEEVVVETGGILKYTAVGSPTVARKMIENGAIFGGEENGGLIFPEMQYCRDGAMSIAKMLECIAVSGPLETQLSELPVYHTYKLKVACPNELKEELMAAMAEFGSDAMNQDNTDGLKLNYEDGWVLIRPSGTEPIYRIYSESKDDTVAKDRSTRFYDYAVEFLRNKN